MSACCSIIMPLRCILTTCDDDMLITLPPSATTPPPLLGDRQGHRIAVQRHIQSRDRAIQASGVRHHIREDTQKPGERRGRMIAMMMMTMMMIVKMIVNITVDTSSNSTCCLAHQIISWTFLHYNRPATRWCCIETAYHKGKRSWSYLREGHSSSDIF